MPWGRRGCRSVPLYAPACKAADATPRHSSGSSRSRNEQVVRSSRIVGSSREAFSKAASIRTIRDAGFAVVLLRLNEGRLVGEARSEAVELCTAHLVDCDLLRSAEHFVGCSGFAPADHRRALLHERHAGRRKQ